MKSQLLAFIRYSRTALQLRRDRKDLSNDEEVATWRQRFFTSVVVGNGGGLAAMWSYLITAEEFESALLITLPIIQFFGIGVIAGSLIPLAIWLPNSWDFKSINTSESASCFIVIISFISYIVRWAFVYLKSFLSFISAFLFVVGLHQIWHRVLQQ